ncbi:hypothetical protein DYB31_011910, partial [Aphanomyces astaci]
LLRRELFDMFLPFGYPDSVSHEYLTFQLWDTCQAMCSYLRGVLATQSVLESVGVGKDSVTPLAAALQWVMRDGSGMLGGLFFAYVVGPKFDANVKFWRLYADVINDFGLTLGEWKGDMQDGHGRSYSSVSGETKEGTWKCHQPVEGKHSEWVILYPNNDKFVGTTQNGERYVGQWANNVRQGKVHFESHEMIEKMVLGYGCHMDAKGTAKDGAWRGDLPVDGDWHIQFASGSSYNGECVGGKPHGHGVCKYTNGDVYSGEWARSGWGVCVFANGHVFQGEWTANHVSLNGKGTLTMANGTVHAYAQ